jgi:uncharacterized protein
VHHGQAQRWFQNVGRHAWSTSAITQLAFVRISSNPKIIAEAVRPTEAIAMLGRIVALPGHHFWVDEPEPAASGVLKSLALVGHRQVTDAYLLALALHNKGKLATFDSGIGELLSSATHRARHLCVIT